MPLTATLQQDSVLSKHILQGKKGGGTFNTSGGGGASAGASSNVIAHYDVQTAYNLNVAANGHASLGIDFANSVKASIDVALNPFTWESTIERMIRVEAFFIANVNPNLARYVIQVFRADTAKKRSIAFNMGANENAGELQMSISETLKMFGGDKLSIGLAVFNSSGSAQILAVQRGEIKIFAA